MKIRPVGADLFHADRHDEANSSLSQLRMRLKIKLLMSEVINEWMNEWINK
jgi:hypothetical protein